MHPSQITEEIIKGLVKAQKRYELVIIILAVMFIAMAVLLISIILLCPNS